MDSKMKEIKLTQGKIALVDDEDFEELNKHRWYIIKSKYCYATRMKSKSKGVILMHRAIMNTPKELFVDHIDHDTLNNQKYNLRNCTRSENMMNQEIQTKRISQYKGVFKTNRYYKDKIYSSWIAKIKIEQKTLYLGAHKTEIEAAIAYNKKATELFGEFALLNTIPNQQDFVKDKIKTDRVD
jgi:hypothetical protein